MKLKYIRAFLQKIGNTWAYSTRKSFKPVQMFGKPAPAGVTFSRWNASMQSNSGGDTFTAWLNDVTDTDAQLYHEEYGSTVYLAIDESLPVEQQCQDILTVEQYEALSNDVDTRVAQSA